MVTVTGQLDPDHIPQAFDAMQRSLGEDKNVCSTFRFFAPVLLAWNTIPLDIFMVFPLLNSILYSNVSSSGRPVEITLFKRTPHPYSIFSL